MATLFDQDGDDHCQQCGYDPCNCVAEVERRLAHAPDFGAPLPPLTEAPVVSRFGVPISGVMFSLEQAERRYKEARPGLSSQQAKDFDLTFSWIEAAMEGLADLRRDTPALDAPPTQS